MCYEAPQQTDVTELTEEQAVDLGKSCNPMWGITVLETEFRSDFRESRNSTLDELFDFGTYRLNLWQHSSSPWLRPSDWDKCAEEYGLSDLEGQACTLGLDFSRTRDMTSAVFVFDLDYRERRRIWPLFWIPENTAHRHQKQVASFLDWHHEGHVAFCEGDTISHEQVLSDIVRVLDVVLCEKCYYDPTFADWVTGRLHEEHGVERVEFKQSLPSYSAPTDQFEQDVLDCTIAHPAHPILDWQVGHCHVYRNKFTKMKRPIKPSEDSKDPRTIDGVAAAVMGYVRALQDAIEVEIDAAEVML